MAGNRAIYDKAMNAGHSAAWDQQWDKAIAAYGRAVQEFPEDPDAHRSLGLALLQARRLEEALKVYTRAHQLAPDDPIPLEKSADVLERMGRLREAAQQYIKVADIYIAQRDLDKAIGNWERATHLTPGLIQIHVKLATAYERTGERKKAIREYLTLAFNFQRVNDAAKAEQSVQRALRLDPDNAQALNTLQALQSGTLLNQPPAEKAEPVPERQDGFDASMLESTERRVGEADPRGPLGEAEEIALNELASFVFESGNLDEGSVFTIQAIELHRQQDTEAAIQAYQAAQAARFRHPGVDLNLGSLLLTAHKYREAMDHFNKVLAEPKLAAGAFHGLGQVFMALKEPRKASRNLVETLRLVDMSLAINNEEREQLNAVYNDLQVSIPNGDERQLVAMNERFFSLLTGADWKQRVAETRRQLEETTRTEGASGMVEQLAEGGEELTEAIANIDRYLRQGYLTLAMDEAHYAIEIAPTYLPTHMRIAQILLAEKRLQESTDKFRLIAETYMIRGQNDRAASILNEVLQVAPMDLAVRGTLIELLRKEERWDAVLEQYIDLADAYYQLTDFDKARETYEETRRLAERQGAPNEQIIHILHRIADIDVSRLDLRQALRTYEQIRSMAPEDERTRKALMDLNYRLNNRAEAIRELDMLMRLYAQQRRPDLIVQVLEEQVALYPDEMALRSRLAAFYAHVGRRQEAVAQLDTLGELQLDAGMHKEAAQTIRQIIALNPPGIEDYQRLLSQLGG